MKREYQKPYLAVESFQLNAAIAGACAGKDNILSHRVNTCTMRDEDGEKDSNAVFFGTNCQFTTVPIGGNNGEYCYQNFKEAATISANYVDS